MNENNTGQTVYTLWSAEKRGAPGNCLYAHMHRVTDAESLKAAVRTDYVCAEYRNSRRGIGSFRRADCLGMDIDNTHTENAEAWVKPEDLRRLIPDVPFLVHFSRNHMKPKDGKPARPRYHVIFPIVPCGDADAYARMKKRLQRLYPFFDGNALDAGRFFYGTQEPLTEAYGGSRALDAFLAEAEAANSSAARFAALPDRGARIPQGSRNDTLHTYAARLLKRLGDTQEAREAFTAAAAKCSPPLEAKELESIWRSALKFIGGVSKRADYILPEDYRGRFACRPEDYTDVGEARMLSRFYMDRLRYSPATDYIRYDGACWLEDKAGARGIVHELTDRQLEEASAAEEAALKEMKDNGAKDVLDSKGKKAAPLKMDPAQLTAYCRYAAAAEYKAFVLDRRDSPAISATLREARPMLAVDPDLLDKDWYLLCTPDATYDLRQGPDGGRPHDPADLITHMTAVSPGTRGADIWRKALDTFFCGDAELIRYVQLTAGIVCLGQVFREAMIIAYGDGRNGKSTFWNTLARVLGSYSGSISADTLTVSCKRNVKPEIAETRGKRLLIAAELQEGMRLNTSTVKQLTSTDRIFAEKKYKAPFAFMPSHTLVLYTNHLPRVSEIDRGTWRRLTVIPFTARIEGTEDIKNYADRLFTEAGPAVLTWMIEGARDAIAMDFRIPVPARVQEACNAYREQNNWLADFLCECCETGEGFSERSGELYNAYRAFCAETHDYTRSTGDFYATLAAEGYKRQRTNAGRSVIGLRLNVRRNGDPRREFTVLPEYPQ